MGQVIGFLTYQNFIEELKGVSQLQVGMGWPVKIRVQDYSKRVRGSVPGMARINFIIEATAVIGDDVFVCRFQMGGGLLQLEDELIECRRKDARQAVEILMVDLTLAHGFDVGRGLVASAVQSETEASATGLWSWQKDESGRKWLVEGSLSDQADS